MALLSDIRRVFRTQRRIKGMTVQLQRIADQQAIIAKALSVIVEREYGIDILAPDTYINDKQQLGEEAVRYVNDAEQAIREAMEELDRDLADGVVDERGSEERMLDEIG